MQSGEPITVKGREYRLGSVLSTGAGSYGQVWAATDAAGRAVAVKFINAEAMSKLTAASTATGGRTWSGRSPSWMVSATNNPATS